MQTPSRRTKRSSLSSGRSLLTQMIRLPKLHVQQRTLPLQPAQRRLLPLRVHVLPLPSMSLRSSCQRQSDV